MSESLSLRRMGSQRIMRKASRVNLKNFMQRRKNVNPREDVGKKLEELFERLDSSDVTNIPKDILKDLSVELHDLTIEDEDNPGPKSGSGKFFRPWTPSRMAEHERNMDSEEIKEDFQAMEEEVVEGCPTMRETGGWETWMWGSSMCYRLMWEVNVVPRYGTEGDSLPLKSITRWRCAEQLPDDSRFQPDFTVNREAFYPKYYWVLPGEHDKPHIKICMYHNAKALPGLVLRSELVAIVAAMITRLGKKGLEKHVIFPVMLFSFMGERHGRILTAHFDGKRLVVHKSELYRFISQTDDFPVHERKLAYQNLPYRPRDSYAGFPERCSFQSASSGSNTPPVPELHGPSTFFPETYVPQGPGRKTVALQQHDSQNRCGLNYDYLDIFTRYLASDVDSGDSTTFLPLGRIA